jgi:hypothetical protein
VIIYADATSSPPCRRSFSFALIAGALFAVVIIINIIASTNLKGMDDGTSLLYTPLAF